MAAVAAAAPVTNRSNAVALALPLVQELEGCQLSAYPDPKTGAEPWTVGSGSTSYADGTTIHAGDTIHQEQADALLAGRLERDDAWLAQRIPGWDALSSHQQAALLSFTYNCGPNWFGSNVFATLSRCLQQGQLEQVPAALLLYINPGGPSEAGLGWRRKAEAALWCTSPHRPGRHRPVAGAARPRLVPAVAATPQPPGGCAPLPAARFSPAEPGAWRSCFSSSWAMLLEALKPGTLPGANGDDQYLAVVQRYGDTTDANIQLQALAHNGVTARLLQDADFQLLEQQIAGGIPVPCGSIHRGPVDRPTGSGHWLIIVGDTPTHLVVNDPWGSRTYSVGPPSTPTAWGSASPGRRTTARLRLRQALDGGADRRECLPLCPGQGMGGGGGWGGVRARRARG